MPLVLLAVLSLGVAAQAAEERLAAPLLENGDFAAPELGEGTLRIPWWIATGDVRVARGGGTARLVTTPEGSARQPLAVYAPLAAGLVVRGASDGDAVLAVEDARGRVELAPAPGAFAITGAELEERLGRPLEPRVTLALSGAAEWRDLEVLVALPLPSEPALRTEILDLLAPILDGWLERALDDVGPRATRFVAGPFDVVTGERLGLAPAGVHPLYEQLARAVGVEPRVAWTAALAAFVDDLISLGMHPDTGLPRLWDPGRDVALDDKPIEVARTLRFLLDLAESGPPPLRARCLDAARRMADGILAHGVLPTGEVAAIYWPSDGKASNAVPPLRRLDAATELVRLGGLEGDERLRAIGRRALARTEYAHAWTGSFEGIDPGFNDFYGNLGARSLAMWRAWPDDPMLGRLAAGGLDFYAPLWHRVQSHGRGTSPDQERAWEVAIGLLELQPERRDTVSALLDMAVRAQLKGQQYDGGVWGDVASYAHAPNVDVENGDVRGLPMNLLNGIALCHTHALGPARETARAMFTAVMRGTDAYYRRRHGYLVTPNELAGGNPSGGGLVFAVGLIEMLRGLEE